MKKKRVFGVSTTIGTALVLLASSLLVSCGKKEAQATVEPVKVKEMIVGEGGSLPHASADFDYSGTVEEENGSSLSFTTGGTITQLRVNVGDRVSKGQLIATVDPTSVRNNYDMAHAAKMQAEDAYKRMKQLHDKGSLPDIKWVEAQSQLQQAKSAENIARKSLGDCRLYAPFSGVISEKYAEVGQNAAPGMPVVKLVTTNVLNVKISVPESEMTNIHVRQQARIEVRALGDKRYEGYVVEKGVIADPVSRSYSVKIRVLGADGALLPGMVSQVSLAKTAASQASGNTMGAVIPASIINIADDNSHFVWIDEGGKAVRRTITIGEYQSNGVVVTSGLSRGDKLIVEGQQKVCSGTKIDQMMKKRNIVEWAMHYRQIIIVVVCCLVAFGVYSLPNMRKNEFPDFTVRQGIVIAVAPGNTAEEMEEQVTKPLENYIFTYKEVKKEKTYSMSRDGIVYIQVQLNDELNNKDEFWSKFKHGVQAFKSELPQNVAAIVVQDDFGDTSSLLITMESTEKTYRELNDYMDGLQDRLRAIKSVGRLTVSGMQQEQISVYLDNNRLAKYGLSDQTVAATLYQKGFTTTGGRIKTPVYTMPIHVGKSLNNIYDIEQQIVYSSPDGTNVRLKDIATVKREYPEAESRITNNGKKCMLLSVEMKKGENIVKMGEAIDEQMAEFQKTLPKDVSIYRITDQSKVVNDSVVNFLHELVIAIVAVVIVVMLLLPMRVALVAASTIPISIFISLGLYNAFGIELNTVTLAPLIVTLGMIVDNSIVIIDNYLEQIGEGKSRWHASIDATTHFFKSIFSATCAISITFFPFLITCVGQTHDFLLSFPWAVTIVLGVSLIIASLLVPFMQFFFIRKPLKEKINPKTGKKAFSFLDVLQKYYDRLLSLCFSHPKTTLALGFASVIAGMLMMSRLPQQTMPFAERNQFAVEIYMPTGTSLDKTSAVADSLEHILRRDKRIVSVTSFKGCASPRFHTAYAPQMAGSDYAQFIVNTTDDKATVAVLDDYADKYATYFPEANIKFKQLSYNEATCPIEVRLSNENTEAMMKDADRVAAVLHTMPELELVRTNFNEPQATTTIRLKEDEATRVGITNEQLESTLAMRYSSGIAIANVWEGDKQVPVMLMSTRSNIASTDNLADEQIPVAGGQRTVPLRQIADIVPTTQYGQIVRRNGVPTITVMAETKRGYNALGVTAKVQEKLKDVKLSPDTKLVYGGDIENSDETMGPTMAALAIAAVMIFFILMAHFRKINLAAIIFGSMLLSIFGAALGLEIEDLPFGVTSVMGLVALMGIIVRNGIIMYDYAEELRETEHMDVRNAIWHSASRRMRPIFLTSAAASMGVIPMILGGSGLWMPMGTVICYGTLLAMLCILTVVPVTYLVVFEGTEKERQRVLDMEKE